MPYRKDDFDHEFLNSSNLNNINQKIKRKDLIYTDNDQISTRLSISPQTDN